MRPTSGLTFDTGALLAAERGDRIIWALHLAALEAGLPPRVPAPVFAEAWRGGPQAQLSRLMRGCKIEVLDVSHAREVGALAAKSGHDDVVDVSVITTAIRCDHLVVLTSDPKHLQLVVSAVETKIRIHVI